MHTYIQGNVLRTALGGVWEEVQAEDGKIFYWNEIEETSQWEKPAAFEALERETIEDRLEHLHFRVHVDGPSAGTVEHIDTPSSLTD